jgi:nitroreductase
MSAALADYIAGATPTAQVPLKATKGAVTTWHDVAKTIEEALIKLLAAPSSLPLETWEMIGAMLAALAVYETLSKRTAG